MTPNQLVRAGYDRIAAAYAEARDQRSTLPHLERLDALLARNSVVLDLGCGAGMPVDRWLIDAGHRVIGLDISQSMLELARGNVPEAEYHLGDIENLETGQFAVDAIVCIFALFHTDRARHGEILGRLRSFLPKSGLLLVTTGLTDWVGDEDFFGARMWWSHFDGPAYRDLIEANGFEILSEDRHGSDLPEDDWHPIYLARAV
ncbi:MAG: methyltransferase domain-containing protein [Pseudomonadota bacterium]